jgi:colicin import membrane protein
VNTATIKAASRDPFMPTRPKGRGKALALALFAHVLLILGLAFGVNWRNSEPTTIAAEIWSAVPQAAAPRAVEPPPTAPPVVKKEETPVKRAEPVAPPKPTPVLPDPQIAIEKAKKEEAKRQKAEQEQEDKQEREKQRAREEAKKDKLEKARADQEKADREKADREKAEKAEKEKAAKADAARQEAIRVANLKRIQGMAGATGGPADTGTALRSSGPSASYAGRIMARIKPNIVFTDIVDGNPMATVEVTLAPDGTIVGKRLVKSSGVKSWDEAVLRAVERTEVLPRDIDGRVPPPFQIDFRPRDL